MIKPWPQMTKAIAECCQAGSNYDRLSLKAHQMIRTINGQQRQLPMRIKPRLLSRCRFLSAIRNSRNARFSTLLLGGAWPLPVATKASGGMTVASVQCGIAGKKTTEMAVHRFYPRSRFGRAQSPCSRV